MSEQSFDLILDDPDTRVIVCCGAGGVGKTTTAAAIGIRAADRGRRVVVLTIDPAKRLAQALGLDALSHEPRRVLDVGRHGGEMFAMQLDMKRTFDEIVLAHADPERAAAILANPFYISLSSSFAGTQEYMAMEKLGQLRLSEEWDLIVVDTPPSRSALDFLDAPQRLGSFLDGRFIRLMTTPAKVGGRAFSRIVSTGLQIFSSTLDKVLGSQLLADIASFIAALDKVFGGFRERAEETYRLLTAEGTLFMVVAAPERDALREASYFIERLDQEGLPLGAILLNRVDPSGRVGLTSERALAGAEALEEKGENPLTAQLLRVHAERRAIADHQERLIAGFAATWPDLRRIVIASRPIDVHDLEVLREIGTELAG
jgi:anion-transporting  ArsA/GET3 family ATPase